MLQQLTVGTCKNSLKTGLRSLRGLTMSLYRLFPSAAISFLLLILFFGFLISKSELAAQASALALVLIASAAIFLRTHSYTEAFLALSVGLLPALSMSWSPARFCGDQGARSCFLTF